MLGNLCIVGTSFAVAEDGKGEFSEQGEGTSLDTRDAGVISPLVGIVSSTDEGGLGTKNLVLAPPPDFEDIVEGDWNKFVWDPPPLLKVSTYLKKVEYNNAFTFDFVKKKENHIHFQKPNNNSSRI